jgi:RIO kinase 1
MSSLPPAIQEPNLDDFEEIDALIHIKNIPAQELRSRHRQRPSSKARPARQKQALPPVLTDQQDVFDFSYHASRHEREWIIRSLGDFYDQRWIDDVVRLVKGGKEASVYLCAANPSADREWIAAKVYRPRRFRNLKNDHLYRAGRADLDADGLIILDDGMQHAIDKRTGFGRELMHTSWIEYEYQALVTLHAAGADTPQPYGRGNNAILMQYIGAPESPAPTLNTVELPRHEARRLFERVLHNVEIMLANQRIHGDLSAYNILYWQGDITLIDFPQVVDPETNRSAYRIFERDLRRICEYFARQGVPSQPARLAASLWQKYGHRLVPEVHPRYLDEDSREDRTLWRKQAGR